MRAFMPGERYACFLGGIPCISDLAALWLLICTVPEGDELHQVPHAFGVYLNGIPILDQHPYAFLAKHPDTRYRFSCKCGAAYSDLSK